MQATLEQLSQIKFFECLDRDGMAYLQSQARVRRYCKGEIIMHEGDRLPHYLFAVVNGTIRISKTSQTGKETILRLLTSGGIFALPAVLGDEIAPATVTAETDCQILTIDREVIAQIIQRTPELALQMMRGLNQRLQQLHKTVHGLMSERAIVRLARMILYYASEHGSKINSEGEQLVAKLSYYQLARSIGITYEECARLFHQIEGIVAYRRGGKITILDAQKLEVIASGEETI